MDPLPPAAEVALADYRKGMKGLGTGLLLLGGLQLLVAVLVVSRMGDIVMGVILAGLAVINIILGVFAYQIQGWVNYVVSVFASLLLVLNCVGPVLLAANADRGTALPGANTGSCLALFILGALIYTSVQNLHRRRRAREKGADV